MNKNIEFLVLLLTNQAGSSNDLLWYKNAIFYEVSLKSFYDSNGDGIGDFKGLTDKLYYLEELGVTAIWILPFYPSPWKDDGYDVADYTSIHPEMGTMQDFDEFLQVAKSKGLRIIIDLVVNHTSDQHPWFKESRKGKNNAYSDYYVWNDSDDKYKDVRIIFNDYEDSNWTFDEKRSQYYWHRFFHHQPDLNYDNLEVHHEILEIVNYWLDKGVDGFRVDAIPYLYEREGTSCENLEETHEFLRKMRKHIDERYGSYQKVLLSESNMWQEDLLPYFGDGEDEFHMGFDFPIMPRIFEALARQDISPLIPILKADRELPQNCHWATFLRNHDELTLEKVTDEVREFMWNYYAENRRARLNLGIRRRLAPLLENDPIKLRLLNVFLFSLPGSPVIYYGDEIGMGDNLNLADRNGLRTPMQWDDTKNAGFSHADSENLVFPVIRSGEYHYKKVNVKHQKQDPDSLLNFMKELIELRKKFKFIGNAKFSIYENFTNKGVIFHFCSSEGHMTSCFNFSEDIITIKRIDQSDLVTTENRILDVFEDKIIDGPIPEFELNPYSFVWFFSNEH